jgi:predicted nucleotidyltransferase
MKFGLKENTIMGIIDVFTSFPEVSNVVLYGSRAKGDFKNGSDIDLVLKGQQLNGYLLNKISLKLDDLYVPYTFDLSIYSDIDNIELLDHINRIGVSFYNKSH